MGRWLCETLLYLRFDHQPPEEHSWTSPMADVMDGDTAQVVRFAASQGKPVVAAEVGTFYYGWALGDPAGAACADAIVTVAEGIIRSFAAGVTSACTWSLFNPNTIDGWWADLAVIGDRVEPAGRGWDIYSLLSQACRPGGRVTPLQPIQYMAAGPCHVHGILIDTPEGPRLAVVNDHAIRPISIRVALPDQWSATYQSWWGKVSDRVRRACNRDITLRGNELELTLPPMSVVIGGGM